MSIFDVGEHGGRHFLSMEHVEGQDLASLLRRFGRLPKERAITIAVEICNGLEAAHQRGILHRDLKPSNLMIDASGRAKIMDFGSRTSAALPNNVRKSPARRRTWHRNTDDFHEPARLAFIFGIAASFALAGLVWWSARTRQRDTAELVS